MDRRKALALAAATTAALGSATVAFAAVSGVSLLGFGVAHATRLGSLTSYQPTYRRSAGVVTIIRTKNVYDRVVVGDVAAAAAKTTVPSISVAAPAPQPARDVAAPAVVAPNAKAVRRHPVPATPTTRPARSRRSPTSTTERTPEPRPPSTTTTPVRAVPPTTTTRPPGVPGDWPPGRPVPPIPPNCGHPELEDNGVWNCGD
jgi:hypothetical protein